MKGKIAIICGLCLASGLFFSQSLSAQELPRGEINWVGGYVTGIGYGTADSSGNRIQDRLNAMRAAEVGAQWALVEIIKGVRIDSQTSVENMIVKEDIIRSRVQGMIKGAHIVNRKIEWQDNVPLATVEMRICFSSNTGDCKSGQSLMAALNLETKDVPPYVPPQITYTPELLSSGSKDSPLQLPQERASTKVKPPLYDSSKQVTGVVFQLEGRSFERELLPVIVTEKKDKEFATVYSVKAVNPSIVRTYGVVRYADSIDQAKKIEYLGDNVMIVPVVSVTRDNMIVISTEAARTIRETIRYDNNYLSNAKVAIISN